MPTGFPFTPVVFPLFAVTPEGKCACGNESCSRVGKHPRVAWGDIKLGDEVPLPEPGAGAGLKTGAAPKGSDVFVVDLDGEEAAAHWLALGGEDEGYITFTVRTPRGWHLYFKHPGFPVKTSAGELSKGIDIRGEGGFVVAPGSPHRSGGTYETDFEEPLTEAPAWLLEWLRGQRAPAEVQHYPGDVTDPEEKARRRSLYEAYLKTEAVPRGPAHRGQGDKILFDVVQRGAYDLALPVDDVLELVREHYDPRCSPQWGDELEERVHHKAHDAKTNSTRPRAEPLPPDLAHLMKGSSLAVEMQDSRIVGIDLDDLEAEMKITWGHWLEQMPPPVYMVDPIVPEASLGVIVAKGSSLKTWLVCSMLAAVSQGKPWLGRFPVEEGPALLVDFESGRDIIQERMQYMRIGDAPTFGIASFPKGRIDQEAFWIALAKIVIARKVRFIAIDSFANGAIGVDENESTAALPLQLATTFIEATKCAVLFVHHAKKGDTDDERDLVRGSGAIYGAADWVYTMVPQDEDRTKMLVRCIKAFRKRTDDFRVALTVDGLEIDTSEEAVDEMTGAQQRILATVRAVPGLFTLADVCRAAKAKSGAFKKSDIESLIRARKLFLQPGKGYQVDTPEWRRRRILAAVRTPMTSTPGLLARAAHVDVEEVNELLTEGAIVKSGTGFAALG